MAEMMKLDLGEHQIILNAFFAYLDVVGVSFGNSGSYLDFDIEGQWEPLPPTKHYNGTHSIKIRNKTTQLDNTIGTSMSKEEAQIGAWFFVWLNNDGRFIELSDQLFLVRLAYRTLKQQVEI